MSAARALRHACRGPDDRPSRSRCTHGPDGAPVMVERILGRCMRCHRAWLRAGAVRSMLDLRDACPRPVPERREHDEQPERDVDADGTVWTWAE